MYFQSIFRIQNFQHSESVHLFSMCIFSQISYSESAHALNYSENWPKIHIYSIFFVFIHTLVPPLRHSALYVFRPFHGSSSEATVFYALCSLDLCTCDIYICKETNGWYIGCVILLSSVIFYFESEGMAMIGWKRVCGVYVWRCMCGGVYRMVYMRLAKHVTRGPPPYRGLYLPRAPVVGIS